MITGKLVIWLLIIAADVWVNYRIIEVNQARPNYLLMNIVRGGVFILYGAFVWDFQYDIWYLNIVIYCATSFWLFFDAVLNLSRHKHLLYIGPTSGWIDRFGIRNPGI